MKKILFILLISAEFSSSVNAQTTNPNITPISIECWGLQQNSFNLSPNIYKHYSCFELPESGTVNITGTREVDLTAGKQVHLKPGFSVNSLTGNGNFHAAVEKEEVGVAVFAPSGTFGEVPKCEKLELGLNLPSDIDEQIDNYFNNIPHNINPFDPEQISIEATFIHYDIDALNYYEQYILPQGTQNTATIRKSLGFYYEEYHTETDATDPQGRWVRDTTSFTFRIRFSPNKTGIWRTEIVIKTDNQVLYTLNPIYFKCTPTARPGFIVGGETASDGRHFVFENGDAFFGIGQNITTADLKYPDMPSGYGVTRAQPPLGYDSLRRYIRELDSLGGNLVRTIPAEWTDAIEWEKLGDYKQAMPFAWEFDRTVDLMSAKEVYFLWCLQLHTPFNYHNPWGDDRVAWPQNPYNTELGLPNPEAFFSDPVAFNYFKKKIRYMMARWGYSPQIAAIQPYSEINDAAANFDPNSITLPLPEWLPLDYITTSYQPYVQDPVFRNVVNNWFHNVKEFIQDELEYNFNVGTSFTASMDGISDNNSILTDADFNDFHPYGNNRNRNLGTRWGGLNDDQGYGLVVKNRKPAILAENGSTFVDLYKCSEYEWHTDLWASSMMGGWGVGLNWWDQKNKQNVRSNYTFMRTFFDTYIDFKNIEWEPRRWPGAPSQGVGNLFINNPSIDDDPPQIKYNNYFESFYMTGDSDFIRDKRAFGWVHNRSSYWYNRLSPCDNMIIQDANSNTNTDDNFSPPGDDDAGGFVVYSGNTQANTQKRVIRIMNMSNFQNFDIRWFNPYTGQEFQPTQEFHGNGNFKISIPDDISYTEFQDLVFLMYPNNSSFYIPGSAAPATEILILEKEQNNLNPDGSLDYGMEINLFPNPTNHKVRIESPERIDKIEIFSLTGDKIAQIDVSSNFYDLDLSGYSKGVYVLKTMSQSRVFINKIIYQ